LPSSPAEEHVDEIKNPSTREVEKIFDGGAVIFDRAELRKKEGRSLVFQAGVFGVVSCFRL
jgi:hypothetical protein